MKSSLAKLVGTHLKLTFYLGLLAAVAVSLLLKDAPAADTWQARV